jgi:hypothetical protein
MESPTTLKAQSDEGAYPIEPFAYKLPDGTQAGAMYSDAQYQPGTPEYTLRSNEQYKAVNQSLFRAFERSDVTQNELGAGAVPSPSSLVLYDFTRNIKGSLPEGANTNQDAAWYVLNTMRPQVRHDAKYVYGKIAPVIKAQMDEAEKTGQAFYPADLSNEQILGIAKQAGVDPWVVARMVAEEGEVDARKATKTYTMGILRPMVDMLDVNSQYGQQVFNDPVREMEGLTREQQRKAFLSAVRWKEYHGESFLGSLAEGIVNLAAEGGYAVGGFVEGGVGAMIATGSEGDVLLENGRRVLSDNWLQKPKEYQDEANSVLQRAHELAKKYGKELTEAANADEDGTAFAATLNGRFGQYADKDDIETFQRLSELKREGAFRPQMSWERLANFGEGVLNAAPNMVKIFNQSLDPTSAFFKTEAMFKGMAGHPGRAYVDYIRGSTAYQQMEAAKLDENIDLWLENTRDAQGDGESMTGFFYRKAAEGVEATIGEGALSGSLREGQRAAGGIMQEKELIQSAALADPVMTVLGGLKLLGVGAKAAAAQKALGGIRAGLQEVTAEAVSLRASANTTSKVFDAAVADLRVKLEAALPGAKFTDDDIIGLAIGDRKSIIGQSPAAQVVRKEIGTTIAKNKGLAKRVNELTGKLDELPDDVKGIEKLRARPVGGAVIQGGGYLAQGGAAPFNAIANLLDVERSTAKGYTVRRILGTASRKILSVPAVSGTASAAFLGAAFLSGDVSTAAIAGLGTAIGTSSVGFLLRPDTLRLIGGTLAQAGRLNKAIGANIAKGQQYGESTFLRGAIDMEEQARKLFQTVPMMPGVIRTAAQEAALAKATMLADDAQVLRRMHKAGLEDAMMNTTRVVWEDGLIAGGTGALLAGLNDTDAYGAGAGMGIGFSGFFRAANRLYQITPKGADPYHNRIVLGDVATIAQQVKDPAQRANMLAFLGDSGADSAGYIRRAGIVRDLYMSTRGQIKFVRGTEFEAATILTSSPEAEANMIMSEAAALHPGDPVKAKEYAAQRKAQLDKSREAKDRSTYLKGKVDENLANIDNLKRSMAAVDAEIAKQQAIVDDEKVNWTDTKKADANKIKLDRLLQQKSELQASLEVAGEQTTVLTGDYNAALGESKVEIPFRPYESRALPDGSTARSVANGFYIVDGPQGKSVYLNIDNIDNIGAVSEGMHALLADSAAESLMPDMVKMLLEPTGDSSGRAVPKQVSEAILTAYSDSLPPAQRAKFDAEYRNGLDLYSKSGNKDISGVVDPLREAMTWMLSAIDLSKRPGYRPGLATPPGKAASATTNWSAVKKTLFGERTLSDNVDKALKNMFDPVYGSFTRKNAANIMTQLEASGMRFVESGDGTLRGYFLNENNEIVRSAVLDAFYERLVDVTGGKGSLTVRPINLYDPMIPVEQRIDFIKRNGMDWVLDERGNIMSPEQVGAKSDGFVRSMEDSLNAIPEGERGMEVYTDADGNVIRTGIPSQVEIAAIANNPNVPQSIKDNFITILKTIGSGESKAVLTAEYSNVFSVNVEAMTAHRLRIGKDIAGKTETRHIVPLAFTMGEAPIYDSKGNKVKVKDPVTGQMTNAKQRVVRVHGFDTQAFQRSVNQSFSGGLYTLDEAGKRTYLKDPAGKDYTATYLRSLFGTDGDFHNAAALWMNHYYKAGPLDPTAAIPMKDGAPRDINPVSAEMLDPQNPVRGAAMRDALRIIYQLESGKKRLGWVEQNRQTNTANGFAIRGTNFPLSDFRLDQFGPLKPNGQTQFIDQRAVTSGQFVMSVRGWDIQKVPLVKGIPAMNIKTVFDLGGGKYQNGLDVGVTEVRVHPSLSEVKIFTGKTSTREKVISYTLGDGKIVQSNSLEMRNVIAEIREKIGSREDAAYVDSILNQWRYDRDKPLPATQAQAPKAQSNLFLSEKVTDINDFNGIIGGLYQEQGGKVPPSVAKFIADEAMDIIANGATPNEVVRRLIERANTRKGFGGVTAERMRPIIDHLKELSTTIWEAESKQTIAYEVPSNTMRLETIHNLFQFGKFTGGRGVIESAAYAFNKENPAGTFKNNKEYLEAFRKHMEAKETDIGGLEGDEFTKAQKDYTTTMEAIDRAEQNLKNEAPQLWEEAPAAEAAGGTGAVINNIDDIVANGAGKASVSIGGKEVAFDKFAVTIDGTDASVAYVELQDKTQTGKGIGKQAYIALGNQLAERGITLSSSGSLLAEGNKLWLSLVRDGYAVRKGNGYAFTPKETAPAAPGEPAAPQGRDITPRAGEAPEAPYMTPEEIAATKEFRVGTDGKITRVTEKERTEAERWRLRYKAILEKRKAEALDQKQTLNENEKKRRAMVNQVRDKAAAEIDAIEQRAAYWRSEAKKKAAADAKAAKEAQKEADQLQAQADARRIAFERAYDKARNAADVKLSETNKLIDVALSSDQPLIAPGLILVDPARMTLQPFRMAVATDTAVTPSATTRTGILYLRNVAGFESNTLAFQQAFANYLFADGIGRGKAIAGEAFRGPMAAQQGINLINSRMWVAEKSGGRLLREYRNADKAAGKDLVTYKVYGANGMLIKQTNAAADAVEAMENLERRFLNTAGVGVLKVSPLEASQNYLDAATTAPATGRPKANVYRAEENIMQIQNMERYRGVMPSR